MRSLDDDDETVAADLHKTNASTQPAWMRALKQSCMEWLELLPKVRRLACMRYKPVLTMRSAGFASPRRFARWLEGPALPLLRARSRARGQAPPDDPHRPVESRQGVRWRAQADERPARASLGPHEGHRASLVAAVSLPRPSRWNVARRSLEAHRATRDGGRLSGPRRRSCRARPPLPPARVHHGFEAGRRASH